MIFLGSMFYQKDMKATLKAIGTRDYRTKVDLIHKTLYSFSYINLHHLFVRSPPFRYILDLSIKNKKEIFENYKNQAKNQKDHDSEDEEDPELLQDSSDSKSNNKQ